MAAVLDDFESRGGLVAEQVKSRALLQRVVALSKERNEAALHLDALSRVLAGEPCNGAGGPSAGEGMKGGGCLSERLAALLTVAERMAAAAPSASAASARCADGGSADQVVCAPFLGGVHAPPDHTLRASSAAGRWHRAARGWRGGHGRGGGA